MPNKEQQIINPVISVVETTGGYVERFNSFNATQNNSWHTVNVSIVDKELSIIMISSSNNRFCGVRETGSTLDRRFRIDVDSSKSMPVKSDGNGDIEVYAQDLNQITFYIMSERNL